MKMLRGLQSRIEAMALRSHVATVVGSFIALGVVNVILNRFYEASNHPVSHAEGQTTFSGSEIKGFYAVMEEAGTIDQYWISQFIDFGFIATMVVFGVSVGMLFSRLNRRYSSGARLGRIAATLIPIGAVFDVIENLISFVLLADPQGFPDWVAVPYSTAAAIKFALIAVAIVLAAVSAIGAVVGSLRNRG